MKSRAIRKISEGEIMEAALIRARAIQQKAEIDFDIIEGVPELEELEAFGRSYGVILIWADEKTPLLNEKARQLFDAYVAASTARDLPDNIQKLGQDSVLYTKPIFVNLTSGEIKLLGMWSLTLSRKDIIQAM
jgi:hypothetical protein